MKHRLNLRALRERHNMIDGGKQRAPPIGEIVFIKGDEKNGGIWKVGIVRAVNVRVGKSHLGRAIQHLYPLKLFYDIGHSVELNVQAEEF